MIKKELVDKIGGYDAGKMPAEDYDLWTKLSRHCNFFNIQEPLLYLRIHENSISNIQSAKQRKHSFESCVAYVQHLLHFQFNADALSLLLYWDYQKDESLHKDALTLLEKIEQEFLHNRKLLPKERRFIYEELACNYYLVWKVLKLRGKVHRKAFQFFIRSFGSSRKSLIFTERAYYFLFRGDYSLSLKLALISWLKNPLAATPYILLSTIIKKVYLTK
jgi:hypothetical protein